MEAGTARQLCRGNPHSHCFSKILRNVFLIFWVKNTFAMKTIFYEKFLGGEGFRGEKSKIISSFYEY
jgi:hypothetical protein